MDPVSTFACPACGQRLTMPAGREGVQGPCPDCGSMIVSPVPAWGLPARRAAPSHIVPDFSPPPPVASPRPPPVVQVAQEARAVSPPPQAVPVGIPIESPRTGWSDPNWTASVRTTWPSRSDHFESLAKTRRRALVALTLLLPLVAAGSFWGGWWMGRNNPFYLARLFSQFPPVVAVPPAQRPPAGEPLDALPDDAGKRSLSNKATTSEATTPDPAVSPPTDGKNSDAPVIPEGTTSDTPPPASILAGAEIALRQFLAAPNRKERAALVLDPAKTIPAMEAYYRTRPDVATAASAVSLEQNEIDPVTKRMLCVFKVVTADAPEGFPVPVAETADGWKADWMAFVEFRDNLFKRFADGPVGSEGQFHLIARNTHYFGDPFPGIESYTAYRLDPPRPDQEAYAFVRNGSEAQQKLAEHTAWGRPSTPFLTLAKRTAANGSMFLEITDVLATDWRPLPAPDLSPASATR